MLAFLLSITDEKSHDKVTHLYNTYHDDMLRFAKGKIPESKITELEAEEAVAEALVNLAIYIDNIDFDRSEDEIRAYVFKTLKNEIVGIVQRREKYSAANLPLNEVILSDDEDDFIQALHIREDYDRVVKAILSLNGVNQMTLYMYFVDGYSVEEIAKLNHVSVGAIRARIRRGTSMVRKALGIESGAKKNG